MTNFQLDETDQKILKLLIENARMPYLEIARECGVSGAAIHQRVKKMENNGSKIEPIDVMPEPEKKSRNRGEAR